MSASRITAIEPAQAASTECFQTEPGTIRWRLHLRSSPRVVFEALSTAEGRRHYWAESAPARDGTIDFHLLGGLHSRGRILESLPDRRFAAEYFRWQVSFELVSDGAGGTDLELTCRGVPDEDRVEAIAGWVSVLLAMKAAVDFGVDLRITTRSGRGGRYADN